jgi:hypothetical protein
MLKYLLGMLLSLGIYSAAQAGAHTEQRLCFPLDVVLKLLKKDYDEDMKVMGKIDTTNEILIIVANEKTGTWSLFVLDKSGQIACSIVNGENFTIVKDKSTRL